MKEVPLDVYPWLARNCNVGVAVGDLKQETSAKVEEMRAEFLVAAMY